MPESTLDHSIPYPSPSDPVRGSTADYLQTDLRDLALGTDSAITTAVGTRAPMSHTHTQSQIEGLSSALDSAGDTAQWGSVSGKPSAYPPSSHSHAADDVTGLSAALDGKSDTSHGHSSLVRNANSFFIDSTGGVHQSVGGVSTLTFDHTGKMSRGSVPSSHVTGLEDRLAAIEYRSGPRDISSILRNGWAGTISLLRIGASVSVYFENLSSANATSTVFLTLPSGFRPPARPGARVYRAMITAGGVPPVMRQADIDPYGHCRIFTTTGVAETFSGSLEFTTPDAIPSTLPGDPA